MLCELCSQDSGTFMLLPLHQPDGRTNVMACKSCALQSSAYCKTHNQIHLGFIDGSTACPACINQVAWQHAMEAGSIYERMVDNLPQRDIDDLLDAANTSASITKSPVEIAMLRFLASKAMRTGQTVEEVVSEVIRSKSVRYILWM